METKLIYKKMVDVMRDIGPVTKDQKNTVQNYAFRGIDQFINALHPALVKHGVTVTPECTYHSQELREVTRSNGKAGVDKHVAIQMCYHFYAEDGSTLKVGPVPAEGVDSGDKATNKALSAALKYALIQTFNVPTTDIAEADRDTLELGTTAGKDVKSNNVVSMTAPTSETKSTSFRRQPKAKVEPVTTPVVSSGNGSGWEN